VSFAQPPYLSPQTHAFYRHLERCCSIYLSKPLHPIQQPLCTHSPQPTIPNVTRRQHGTLPAHTHPFPDDIPQRHIQWRPPRGRRKHIHLFTHTRRESWSSAAGILQHKSPHGIPFDSQTPRRTRRPLLRRGTRQHRTRTDHHAAR
jgi:hypothetical protein